jgi:hypothetical protein
VDSGSIGNGSLESQGSGGEGDVNSCSNGNGSLESLGSGGEGERSSMVTRGYLKRVMALCWRAYWHLEELELEIWAVDGKKRTGLSFRKHTD